jgi:hypothetical protein
LNNILEYRGVIYDDGTHERLSPVGKDLFVRGENFANSLPQSTSGDALEFSIHRLDNPTWQNAFEEAGIVVHDVTGMPSFDGTTEPCDPADPECEPPHLDILIVTNVTHTTETIMGYQDGSINHVSPDMPRFWTWDYKGASYVGNESIYAVNTDTGARGTFAYHLNLMHYFYNRPYMDDLTETCSGPEYIGLLDPLGLVEDYLVENGTGPDKLGPNTEDRCDGDGTMDGDIMDSAWPHNQPSYPPDYSYNKGHDLSVFDADADGLVENPVVDDPLTITREYAAWEVQLHTVIHEMGHAAGMDAQHTTDPTCVMYQESIDWDRAGHFCPYARGQMRIHNQ